MSSSVSGSAVLFALVGFFAFLATGGRKEKDGQGSCATRLETWFAQGHEYKRRQNLLLGDVFANGDGRFV